MEDKETCRSCRVLQPTFRWEHTECTGLGPDIRGGPRLYFKKKQKKNLWLYEEFIQDSHLCLQFPQNILCLHVFVCFGSSQFEKYSPFPLTWSGIVYILAALQRPFFEKILGVSSRAQQPDENTADMRLFCSSGLFLTFQKAQRPLGDII